ncbi:MAG TPA: hypothetical protein VFM54_13525 [Micromonosporaceae bacterium]|nr:hypothetical protein [Micromonosporaceae bacterium]
MTPPVAPEAVRDAKGWLSKRRGAAPYKETADQTALTAVFDMQAARRGAPSFDKLWREAERLIGAG